MMNEILMSSVAGLLLVFLGFGAGATYFALYRHIEMQRLKKLLPVVRELYRK